jgi:hypothetical protein
MPANRGEYNQNHGVLIENMVRETFGFEPRYINDYYDIPAEYNSEYGVPISIKATCTDILYLADARRWWGITDPLQIVATRYASVNGTVKKVWFEVRTYLLSSESLDVLRGNIPYESVELFHNDIHGFGPGEHAAARVLAKRRRVMLENVYGPTAVRLNPKIDSKHQRRLQCSVHFDALAPYLVRTDTVKYRGIRLPAILDMEKDVKK